MTAEPDFMAQLIDVLRAQIPKAGDQITRRVLRLFLRTGWRFENYVGPLVDIEQRGWLKGSGETYTTTDEGARAFRRLASGQLRLLEPASPPAEAPRKRPAARKARRRR